MGLFGNSYAKPGKGISKEEAAKRNYFDMAGRHFFDLVKVNLLFVACTLVFIIAELLLLVGYYGNFDLIMDIVFKQHNIIVLFPLFVPFLFIGPFVAGLTYVLRNWARQEHAFLVSDFFEHTKKNWKQGLLLSVVNTVFIFAFTNAFLFYSDKGLPLFAGLIVYLLVLALWFMTNFYTYTIMVTFKMSFAQIIRNSILLALAKLPQNLFFVVIIVAAHGVLLWYLPIIWILLMAIVLIALSGFTINYYSWHVIDKYMMPKDEEEQEEAVFEDVK
ncbi:MAG: DUF624 domain-containing protein [Ruminococcaceae bacterium]|nr:DUF624 domain-containing protein [Oscillospiraceae bacterium]